MGLVSQVVDVFFSQKCVRLGKTFAALTVTDLANQVFPSPVSEQGTEAVVSSFIMSGVMNATMVHTHDHNKSSILRFAATQSTAQLSHELDLHSWFKDERRLMGLLLESLRETNNNLGLSDEYVDSLHRGQVWSGSNDVNAIVGEEAGLEMDEDLMGDMS